MEWHFLVSPIERFDLHQGIQLYIHQSTTIQSAITEYFVGAQGSICWSHEVRNQSRVTASILVESRFLGRRETTYEMENVCANFWDNSWNKSLSSPKAVMNEVVSPWLSRCVRGVARGDKREHRRIGAGRCFFRLICEITRIRAMIDLNMICLFRIVPRTNWKMKWTKTSPNLIFESPQWLSREICVPDAYVAPGKRWTFFWHHLRETTLRWLFSHVLL